MENRFNYFIIAYVTYPSVLHVLLSGVMFLLSVVTDKFLEWTSLPMLVKIVRDPELAALLHKEYISYHHLVNTLTPQEWIETI